MFVRIYIKSTLLRHYLALSRDKGARLIHLFKGWFGNYCSFWIVFSTSGLASLPFSSAGLKFEMTLGRKERSRQTNLPLLSSAEWYWGGQRGEDSGQTSQDKDGRDGEVKDAERGKFKQISLSSVPPPDVCVPMIINPAEGRIGTGWVWKEGVAWT